jgi:4-diphosphocytidyl-2-C-methyl-D-erythritol kinase
LANFNLSINLKSPNLKSKIIRVRAHAKLNLTLRVLGLRPDGYHELRTVFQSLALHDTLTVVSRPGPFQILCNDPGCPVDESNLVWRAAEQLWRRRGRRGAVSGVQIRIVKRIPMQAGLGGGSSDAAAALTALAVAWRMRPAAADLGSIGRQLGADVPFFFEGGTVLGLERGDLLFPLPDVRASWVVLALPSFGVSTKDAYGWWDAPGRASQSRRRPVAPNRAPTVFQLPSSEIVNDLEDPVVAHHPDVGRLVSRLRRLGAVHTAMSGSGSAVFGLFATRDEAERAARSLSRPQLRVLVTRTVGRNAFQRSSLPRN